MNLQEKPGITVITVCFNDKEGLEKTIHSVREQKGARIEHIVIDGGSTDGSLDIIQKHEQHISKWISGPDKGPYDGMNRGLEMVTLDWVIFLNAGDIFFGPDSLSSLVDTMQKEDVIAVYGDSLADYGDFRVYRRAQPFEKVWRGMVFSHQALLIRASQLGENRFDLGYPKIADYDLVLRCLAGKQGVAYVSSPLVVCDAHGISTKGQAAIARDYYRVSRKYFTLGTGRKMYFLTTIVWLSAVDILKKMLPTGVYYKFVKGIKSQNQEKARK